MSGWDGILWLMYLTGCSADDAFGRMLRVHRARLQEGAFI